MIQGPRQHNPLTLSAAQIFTVFGNYSFNALRILADQVIQSTCYDYFIQSVIIIVVFLESNVTFYRIMQQKRLLFDVGYPVVPAKSVFCIGGLIINVNYSVFL